jgi:hypothetical protein
LNAEEVRTLRAAGQRLDTRRGDASAAEVVSQLVAVQAQDQAAASLGVGVRSDRLSAAAVDAARNSERSIVRLWCLRGTLHLAAAEDVHWLLELVRPSLAAANRRRRAELGLDDDATARGVQLVADSLRADGPLTRPEIAERLRSNGIASEGQATIHVIWRAAIDGLVCYGPDRDGVETFVSLDRWIQPGACRKPAHPALELAQRYLAAYGPASREDFLAWSGLPRSVVDRAWSALSEDLSTEDTPFGQMRLLRADTAGTDIQVPRLLPAFDGVWLGYRDHTLLIDAPYVKRVFPGGGVIRPLVFAAGRIVGTWSRKAARRGVEVSADLFQPVGDAGLEAAVNDFAAFVQQPARLVKRTLT